MPPVPGSDAKSIHRDDKAIPMSSFRPRSRSSKAYDLLPPEKPRAPYRPERMMRPAEVEDAEFTVISEHRNGRRVPGPAFTVVPPGNDNGTTPFTRSYRRSDVKRAVGTGSSRFVAAGEHLLARLSDNMFSALVAVVFLLVFAFAGGFSALAMMGKEPVVRGVGISHVTALPRTVNGLPMLVISGIIENHGEGTITSPKLRAEIYSAGQLVQTTLLRSRTGDIASGESRGFQMKLPQAGGKAPEVKVVLAE